MSHNNRFLGREFDSFFEDLLTRGLDASQRKNILLPLLENKDFIATVSTLIQSLRENKKSLRRGKK